ncbi:hypothetical protein Aduo_019081 [Ancylostoma duodenale]
MEVATTALMISLHGFNVVIGGWSKPCSQEKAVEDNSKQFSMRCFMSFEMKGFSPLTMVSAGQWGLLRLGVHTWMLESFTEKDESLSFIEDASLGIGAGACGALVGTLADLALIRMTYDGQVEPAGQPVMRRSFVIGTQRLDYKNVIESLFRIAKKEGIFTWFRVRYGYILTS